MSRSACASASTHTCHSLTPRPKPAIAPSALSRASAGTAPSIASRKRCGWRVAVRIARDVVDEHVVDPREPEPLQAVVDAAQRAVVRIVPALDERQHVDVAVLVARRVAIGCQQAADLRRQQVGVARRPRAVRRRSGARTGRCRNAARCRSSGRRDRTRGARARSPRRPRSGRTGCRAARRRGPGSPALRTC